MSMSFQLVSVITSHYLSMKESCLFGFSRSNLLNHGTSCHSFGTIGKLYEYRCTDWFYNVSTYNGEVIEH
jgi:hypothetical protein